MIQDSPSTHLETPPLLSWRPLDRLLAGLVVLITLAIYFQTRSFQFLDYDDHLYVYQNIHVLQGLTLSSLNWARTAIVVGNWHPLTIFVELVLVTLFGPSPAAFHLTNALLHALNVLLLYTFIRASTGRSWAAFFVASLWGLHPLRVESIAWVSELKDVLCGAMWLTCMLVYLRYSQKRTWLGYLLVLLLQGLALAAKPMAATLPGVLLLLDFWPIRQKLADRDDFKWWTIRLLEKLPLAALCVWDLTFALRTQRGYTGPGSIIFSPVMRVENALISVVAYLRDIVFPHHLSLFYPHPGIMGQTMPADSALLMPAIFAAAFLLLVSAVVLLRLKSQPYLAMGWFWFVGTLVPVLGFVRLGDASRADRYTYIPSMGITIAVVFLAMQVRFGRQTLRAVAAVLAGAAIIFAILTSRYLGYWKDNSTLFGHLLSIQPDDPLAIAMCTNDKWKNGHLDEAFALARHGLDVAPRTATVHVDYALTLQAAKRYPEAVDEFANALRLDPAEEGDWDGLGTVRALEASEFAKKNDPQEKAYREKAIVDFRTAIELNDDAIEPREHLASELAALGRIDEAIAVWQKLVDLKPDYAQAQGDLADALRLKQDLLGAVEHYRLAIKAGAKEPQWEMKLAYLVATNPLESMPDVQPMVAIAKDACDQTHNKYSGALDAYAACLARVGRFDDAIAAANQGIAQANAAGQQKVAAGIEKRLAFYQRGTPYVVGAEATSQPTTGPAGAVR